MRQRFILYGTDGCHLCDLARELVHTVLDPRRAELDEVDICGDDELEARYGVRIPVLKLADSEAELGWPFDVQQLRQFAGR